MALLSILFFSIALIAIAVISYIIIIFNGLISLKNNITKSFSNIDVLLKQRSDEIPNLVSTIKGYMNHEKDIISHLVQARASMMRATQTSQKAQIHDDISNTLKSIFALSENYPQLKASDNFLKLQQRLSALENEIADRREFYNDSVTAYNIRIQTFPDLIVAKLLGYKEPAQLFSATDEEKEKPGINFK